MRKRVTTLDVERRETDDESWLDLEPIAEVEITSEQEAFPIESALLSGDGPGWRASLPGEQRVRIVFDERTRLERIRLVFEEPVEARTQEFVLRWSPDVGEAPRDVVRQQWTFHPPDCTREVEDYRVDLADVKVLELVIVPDTSGGPALASLRSMRLT